MVSPQNLAIGAAAVGLAGREGDIFRRVVDWSVLLVLIMAVIVLLQSSSVLSWMVPGPADPSERPAVGRPERQIRAPPGAAGGRSPAARGG